ncbi:hypothetical protein WJX72_007133 [[Myrmecia] bisecta]|uniref:Cysteine dioxygenase n=1 Tax=[Myrmecia] bisecta TaxID=41462 RepID=A0AAW1Q7E5_9CHLO
MRAFITRFAPLVVAFLIGWRFRTAWDHATLVKERICTDVYAEPLQPAVYALEEMDPFIAPGLPVHMTAAGHVYHGTRQIEVWLQTLRPGQSTPIHNHDCEEINIVLKGEGMAHHRSKDGSVVGRALHANSTALAQSGTIYQMSNTGQVAMSLLVVMGCAPASITVHEDWEAPVSQATRVFPMFWDRTCPSKLPRTLQARIAPGRSRVEL